MFYPVPDVLVRMGPGDVARRLANRLEAAKPAGPCIRVSTDIDVHFVKRKRTDDKFSFQRPDVSVYLVIFLDGDFYGKTVHEYRLDWASRTYRLADTHEGELTLEDPFPATVAFNELDG